MYNTYNQNDINDIIITLLLHTYYRYNYNEIKNVFHKIIIIIIQYLIIL